MSTIAHTADCTFTWRAHPARERPGLAALAIAIIVALTAAAWLSFGPAWAAGSPIILILALNRFFLPSHFEIDDDGIAARYPLKTVRLAWGDVRRFLHDHRGGFLSTRAAPSRLDAYSGMHLLFGHDRAQVIELIRARLNAHAGGEA